MPNLSEISNGTKLLLGAGILLLIDSFLNWQEVDLGPLGSVGESAWGTVLGIIMGLALIVLLAWVLLQVLNVKLNFELPITEAWLTLGLGVAVFALALLKNLVDDFSAWPSYVGVALAALVALGAWMRAQDLGGIGAPAATTAGTTMGVGDEPASGPADTDMATAPSAGTPPAQPVTPSAPTEPGMPATTAGPVQPGTPAAPPPPPQAAPPMTPAGPLDMPTRLDEPSDTTPETRDEDETPPETRSTL